MRSDFVATKSPTTTRNRPRKSGLLDSNPSHSQSRILKTYEGVLLRFSTYFYELCSDRAISDNMHDSSSWMTRALHTYTYFCYHTRLILTDDSCITSCLPLLHDSSSWMTQVVIISSLSYLFKLDLRLAVSLASL
jgi:hypothetical protein